MFHFQEALGRIRLRSVGRGSWVSPFFRAVADTKLTGGGIVFCVSDLRLKLETTVEAKANTPFKSRFARRENHQTQL